MSSRKLMISFALALSWLLCGCGGSSGPGSPRTTAFAFEGPALTAEQQQSAIDSFNFQRDTWALDFGRPAPGPAGVTFVNAPLLANGRAGETDGKRITVIVGGFYEAPFVYHELCHMAFGDGPHSDPGWATWDYRGSELSNYWAIYYGPRRLVNVKAPVPPANIAPLPALPLPPPGAP